MHVLALLQQAQVQRAAQDALDSLDKQALQAEAASEQLQELAIKVLKPSTCRHAVPAAICCSMHPEAPCSYLRLWLWQLLVKSW